MGEGYISNDMGKFLNGDTSSNDFNNYLSSGFYFVTSNMSNSPWSGVGLDVGNMLVIASENFIHQVIFFGAMTIFMRRFKISDANWSSWYKIQMSPV